MFIFLQIFQNKKNWKLVKYNSDGELLASNKGNQEGYASFSFVLKIYLPCGDSVLKVDLIFKRYWIFRLQISFRFHFARNKTCAFNPISHRVFGQLILHGRGKNSP